MLVRDLRTGRLVMLDGSNPSTRLQGYRGYGGQWAGDERLGLPFLAALPALAAKVLPLVSSILPMLSSGGSKSEPASTPAPSAPPPQMPASPPTSFLSTATALLPQAANAFTSLLPMPLAQTTNQALPSFSVPGPPESSGPVTRVTSIANTEEVLAPMRVRQPDGSTAVVPVRVRRRRRKRRVRLIRTNSQPWATPSYAVPYVQRVPL